MRPIAAPGIILFYFVLNYFPLSIPTKNVMESKNMKKAITKKNKITLKNQARFRLISRFIFRLIFRLIS